MPCVLLVDDNADTVEMYAVGLASAGYRSVGASDVNSALRALRNEHPDAVVTDLQLVGLRDGWALIEALKADPSTRELPVIVLTGHTDPSIPFTAQQVGCAVVLTKPCLPDELALAVRRVLPAVA